MRIKIQKIKNVKTPCFACKGDAGIDLYSAEEDYILKPGERKSFSTGIKMEIPENCAGLIWDKSGLALKSGIKTMGGVIDSTYRGEVMIILINFGNREYLVEKNTKIAQLLIQKTEQVKIEETDSLSKTSRGSGGFGSTGLK